MKRLALWSLTTVLLMLFSAPGLQARAAALAPLSAADLASTTAGVCTNCHPPADQPPAPPRVTSHSWEIISTKAGNPTQLSYVLARQYANASSQPVTFSYTFDNECKRVLTSGSLGVSKALNLTVGTVYHCAVKDTAQIVVPPRTGLKIYKGYMRAITTYVAREIANYSDGSREPTGRTDTGSLEHNYVKFTIMDSAL